MMATSLLKRVETGRAARRGVELETARLRLRPFDDADLDALCRITADTDVMQYIGEGRPLTREETAANLSSIIGAFRRRGFGRWAMVEKASGALLGYCGLARPTGSPYVELVYMLDRPAWGRGLATEASAAVLRYGFEELRQERVYAFTMPGNARSRRVLERLGMEYLREDSYYGYACVSYALTRERWRPDHSLYRLRRDGAAG
jgi:RimJ/RimL family protein N-acetyltransferase